MKVNLIYFTQTGNTRRIARTMAEVFQEAGWDTRTISLKKVNVQDAVEADLLGIGSPCFSSQAPTPIKNFLSSLPPLPHKKAFVFATSGTAPGRVLYDLYALLNKKNADVIGGFLARGMVHHPAPCLYGRLPDRPNDKDFLQARQFATEVIRYIHNGFAGKVEGSRADTFKLRYGFYDFVAFISSDAMLRFLMPKPKLNMDRCNQCRWCEFECPVHNIALHPYPTLDTACIRCYRCVNGCPQKAYSVNWKLANWVVYAFYNKTFTGWFGT